VASIPGGEIEEIEREDPPSALEIESRINILFFTNKRGDNLYEVSQGRFIVFFAKAKQIWSSLILFLFGAPRVLKVP
jgi:hypothetical protein